MKKIVVVSQEETLRKLVSACLRKGNYRILHLDDPNESIAFSDRERPDLLIVDRGRGKLAGGLTLGRTGSHNPKVLMISDDQALDSQGAEAAGADGLLHRPFSPSTLRAHIHQLLAPVAEAEAELA